MEKTKFTPIKANELQGDEKIYNSHGFLIGTFTGFETPFGLEVKHNSGFIDVPLCEAFIECNQALSAAK